MSGEVYGVRGSKPGLAVRVAAVLLGASAVLSAVSCIDEEPNDNYCATINGDVFCRQHHGSGGGARQYCILGSAECREKERVTEPDSFDGCVAAIRFPTCHSPCGGGLSGSESCDETGSPAMTSSSEATSESGA